MSRKGESSLAFGGQAVIEGVMIRSQKHMVVCVRQPNNEIMKRVEEISSLSEQYRFLKWPFLRGILALFETLYLGVRGLQLSANAILDKEERLDTKEIVLTIVGALALAVLLFSVVPFFLTNLLKVGGIIFNVVEAGIRLTILLVYLGSVALVKDFRRIFQYHGAEHTAINAFEAGVELNVSSAKSYSRFHPRCGTSFILIVTLISILLFSLMPSADYFVRLAYRILLIPVIGGISYEVLKVSGRYRDSRFMKLLVAPGVGMQYLTTKEPDEGMIEVALEAVKEVQKLLEPRKIERSKEAVDP